MSTIDLSYIAEELRADIQSAIMSEVREICIETLKRFVQSGVYSDGASMYQRTMQFLNAVDVINLSVGGTEATFDLTVDPSKLSMVYNGINWPAHGSAVTLAPFTDGLVEVLDQGGGAFRGFGGHPAGNFFENTKNELDSTLVQALGGALAARGWEVSY